jgi:hypothetical protein
VEASLRNCLRFMGISPRAIRFNYWTPLAGWNASDEMLYS